MDDIERAVGRLEGKIEQGFKDLCSRVDRLNAGVFAEHGIESRLRECEGGMREIKAKAGLIAFIVSLIIGASVWIMRLFDGR